MKNQLIEEGVPDIRKVRRARVVITNHDRARLPKEILEAISTAASDDLLASLKEVLGATRPAVPSTPSPALWRTLKRFKSRTDGPSEEDRTKKYGMPDTRKYPGISHVILAEDDPDDAEFFSRSLSSISSGIKLSVVADGHELIKTLRHSEPLPNIIFLDINMPRKNGYECVREIRSDKKLRELPVVIISTSGDRQTVDALYELGASAFIAKPKNFSSWALLIDKVLSRKWMSPRVGRDQFLIGI